LVRKDHVSNVNREILDKNSRMEGLLSSMVQQDVTEEELENVLIIFLVQLNLESDAIYITIFCVCRRGAY
jgi:hypothetical protein